MFGNESQYAVELAFTLPDGSKILFLAEKAETDVSAQQTYQEYPASFWYISPVGSAEMILQGKCRYEAAVHREKITDSSLSVSLLLVDEPTLLFSSDMLSVAFIPKDGSDLKAITVYFGLDTSAMFSSVSEMTGSFFID